MDESVLALLLLFFFAAKRPKVGGRPVTIWNSDDMFVFGNTIKNTGVPVWAALSVYTAESNLDPKAVNKKTQASGLAQIMPSVLLELGYTDGPAAFRKLSVADQAPWIARLLEYQIRIIGFTPNKALDLYVANLSPAASKAHAFKIYSKDNPAQADAYNKNAGLDTAGKGWIDRDDLGRVLAAVEQTGTYGHALDQWNTIERALRQRGD